MSVKCVERRQEIFDRYLAIGDYASVGEEFGISRQRVQQVVREIRGVPAGSARGAKLHDEPPALTPTEEIVVEGIAGGLSDEEISAYITIKLGGKQRSPRTAQSHVQKVKAFLIGGKGADCRALAIACHNRVYGTPKEIFDQGALAQREKVLLEIERLRALDTVGGEAKKILGELGQDLRLGKLSPEYGGRE